MSNTPRLSKSGIEYLDYVWNFYSGCRHKEQGKCPPVPCWAEEMAGRFKGHYPSGFAPTFYPEAFFSPLSLKKPARIGVCFMGDLFGEWNYGWRYGQKNGKPIYATKVDWWPTDDDIKTLEPISNSIKDIIRKCPQHTFVFLTKNPAGMRAWSPFPDNCEVGFSAWSPDSFVNGLREITKVDAKMKWCSLEPLLEWSGEVVVPAWELLDWVAIGALTGTKKQIMEMSTPIITFSKGLPDKVLNQMQEEFNKIYTGPPPRIEILDGSETFTCPYPALTPWKLSASNNRWGLMPPVAWLENIVRRCDAAGTKVFIKDNLWYWLIHQSPGNLLFWKDDPNLNHLRQECGAREKKEIN